MAMGCQKDRQGDLMVSWSEMPRSPGHVFYDRLQSVAQQPEAAERFGRVLVMRNGRVVEDGRFEELNQADSALGQLIATG